MFATRTKVSCRWLGVAEAATAAALAVLLSACASNQGPSPSPIEGALGEMQAPTTRVAAGPSALPVPHSVAADIAQLSGRAGVNVQQRIELRELELAPGGPRVLLARGTGELCHQDNCPYGLYVREAGAHRPVLLTLSSTMVQVHPIGHLGYPDLSAMAIESSSEFRLRKYQWDGVAYAPVSCRFVNRLSRQSRNCVPTKPSDTSLLATPPAALCQQVRRMATSSPAKIGAVTMLQQAFLIRGDTQAHVEAFKLSGEAELRVLEPLVRCLRSGGVQLQRMERQAMTGSLTTAHWVSMDSGSSARPVVSMSSTYLPSEGYTLISFGVFANAAAGGLGMPAAPAATNAGILPRHGTPGATLTSQARNVSGQASSIENRRTWP